MSSNDTVSKTLVVATLLCIICSVVVSSSAVLLRAKQAENKDLDRKRNILAAAGLLTEGRSIEELFARIEVKLVDFASGDYLQEGVNPQGYDQRKAAKDSAQNTLLSSQEDIASIKQRANIGVVYLAKNEQGELQSIILPVHGYGLWSTLYGFLALEKDAKTVAGLGFYEHAETPGLGGEVDNPVWKAQWSGKKLYNAQGQPDIKLYKGKVTDQIPQSEHKFDSLSGATITTRGVQNLLEFWVGDRGFGPYLKKLQSEGV